jgi:hypothetical protein
MAESNAIHNSPECANSQIPPLHNGINEFLHFGRQFLSLFHWDHTLPIFRSHVIPGAPPIAQILRLIYYMCPEPIFLGVIMLLAVLNRRSVAAVDEGIDRRSAVKKHNIGNLPAPTFRH